MTFSVTARLAVYLFCSLKYRSSVQSAGVIGWRSAKGLSVYFEVKNIVDTTYTATSGVVADAGGVDVAQFLPGEGRGFYGGVEWRW